ncbi:MAG: hypothetical protein JO129_03310, partial [Candidatus Dependentiae bacterium]|nr:hypothetical protein [Candidatus Dependentiae bacterium]
KLAEEKHRHPNPTTAARTRFADKNWKLGVPFLKKHDYTKLVTESQPKAAEQHSILQAIKKGYKPEFEVALVSTKQELMAVCDAIKKAKFACINLQGTNIDPMLSSCESICIAVNEKTVHHIPFHTSKAKNSLSLADAAACLKSVFADTKIEKVMHNAKFKQIVLEQHGMPVHGTIFDISVAANLLMHNEEENSHKVLVEFYAKNAIVAYHAIKSTKKSAEPFLDKDAWNHVADTHQTLALKSGFEAELKKEKMLKLFETIEMPVNTVLADMEFAGISCDAALLKKLDEQVSKDVAKLHKEISSYSKTPINVNSVPQIRKLLFDTLKLPVQKKLHKSEKLHKRRQVSTDAETLIELTKFHPIAQLILNYRELFKFKRAYLESLPKFINKKTHKIHAFWDQSLGITDRITCSHPNLQSIPTNDFGYKSFVRSAFVADKETFIAADYNDIALHVLAHLSQDKALKADLAKKVDINAQTAAHLYATTQAKVTAAQRSVAKKINTSIAYGLTPYGLASDQHISIKQAEFALSMFFKQYSSIESWMEKTVAAAKKNLHVSTIFGKKRFIPNIMSKNRVKLDAAERLAINAIVQGSATEIMKVAMIAIHEKIAASKLQAEIVLNLHDQLVVSAAKSDLEATKKIVEAAMKSAAPWNESLPVTILTGKNWHDVTII